GAPHEAAGDDEALLPRREGDVRPQGELGMRRDPLDEALIRGGHRKDAACALPVEQGDELQTAMQPGERPFRLERDEKLCVAGEAAVDDRAPEARKIFRRDVPPACAKVGDDVAQDVPELECDPEVVGERLRTNSIRRPEDAEAEAADRPRYA